MSNDFNISNIATARTNADWEAVLLRILQGVLVVYIVVDLELLEDALLEPENIVETVRSLSRLIGTKSSTVLRLAILGQRRQQNLADLIPNSSVLDIDGFIRRNRARARTAAVIVHERVMVLFRWAFSYTKKCSAFCLPKPSLTSLQDSSRA
ncbi:hypothetical protein TI39_contig5938g00002 [Zymoseptoria brevis]|uniref:Uncharacterized protein n=1 Tax=Zymoseptoria brevis TaxID=1047168 RepID=A0A0F4G3X0_9PEZI|nr:hypothetical protein TI39_contig5938g00002 [Zymoseptoria brevis]